MKLLSFVFLLSVCFYANRSIPDFPPPPGTVKIGENVYLDKKMIGYGDYKEFLFYLKQNDPVLYTAMLPADTGFTYKGSILWGNEKFADFPIVGLSREQIGQYCAWRSEAVNAMIFHQEMRCGNLEYWEQFDALDPVKQYKVVYTLACGADLQAGRLEKGRFYADEYTTEGIFRKPGKEACADSREMIGFRCRAVFVQID